MLENEALQGILRRRDVTHIAMVKALNTRVCWVFALLGHVFLVRDSSVVNMNTRFLMKGGLCSEATGHAPAVADRLICSAAGVMAPAGGHKIQGSL